MGRLEITLVRGLAGKRRDQIGTLRCLGLRKPRQRVIHEDNPCIRGMVRKVAHLVKVREIEE